MGCDIHMFCEFQNEKGKWEKAGAMFEPDYVKKDRPVIEGWYESEGFYSHNKWLTDQPYHMRNYDVFAWLADVRNGRGFAGCDTGDAVVPVAEPRGLPDDVSVAVKKLSDDYGSDGHSHSFLTLAEIMSADTSAPKVHRAFVDMAVYRQWKSGGSPYPNCGGVSGGGVVHVDNAEMDLMVSGVTLPIAGKSYYTQIEWSESQADMLKDFMESMRYILGFSPSEKARVVFWFDN